MVEQSLGEPGPVPEDQMWCVLRGRDVPVTECATSCADHAQREVCWMDEKELRALEGRLTRLRLPVVEQQSLERWEQQTALVIDPTVQQAFLEGRAYGLREADRQLNEERERQRKLAQQEAAG